LVAVPEVPARLRRHAFTVPTEPGAVTTAGRETTSALAAFGITPGTSFMDAVLLIVGELVANAVRHAADCSPTVQITLTVRSRLLVIDVADRHPDIPRITPETAGDGLLTVLEVAAEYDGSLAADPAPHGAGKTMRVQLALPNVR
jgi:signal transduction histidine kinase